MINIDRTLDLKTMDVPQKKLQKESTTTKVSYGNKKKEKKYMATKVNVGGTVFEVPTDIIHRSRLLTSLCGGTWDDLVFIDRSPTSFLRLLQYLADPLSTIQAGPVVYRQVELELHYFLIEPSTLCVDLVVTKIGTELTICLILSDGIRRVYVKTLPPGYELLLADGLTIFLRYHNLLVRYDPRSDIFVEDDYELHGNVLLIMVHGTLFKLGSRTISTYNYTTRSWQTLPPPPATGLTIQTVVHHAHHLYTAMSYQTTTVVLVYDIVTRRWSQLYQLNYIVTSVQMCNGRLFLLGYGSRRCSVLCFDTGSQRWEPVPDVPPDCRYIVHQDILYYFNPADVSWVVYDGIRGTHRPDAVDMLLFGGCKTRVTVLTYAEGLPPPPPPNVLSYYQYPNSVVTVVLNDNVRLQTTRATLLALPETWFHHNMSGDILHVPLPADQFEKVLQLLRDGTLDCVDMEEVCRFLGLVPLDVLAGTAILDRSGDVFLSYEGFLDTINITINRDYKDGISICAWNGKLWVVGGGSDRVECIDLFRQTVLLAPSLPHVLQFAVAIFLTDGIHVLGNAADGQVHHYRRMDDCWEELSPLPLELVEFAVAAIDDRLYVMGGRCVGIPSNIVWMFDTEWHTGPSLPVAIYDCRACVQDTTIYLSDSTNNAPLMWDTTNDHWVILPRAFNSGRFNLLIVDGQVMATSHRNCRVLNPTSSTWDTVMTVDLHVRRYIQSCDQFRWYTDAFAVHRARKALGWYDAYLRQILSLSRIIDR
jgi:hypothetical protein